MTKENNQPFDSVYWRLTNFFEKTSEETKTKEEEETKTEFGFCEDNTTKKLNQEGTNCKEYLYKGFIGLFQKKTD